MATRLSSVRLSTTGRPGLFAIPDAGSAYVFVKPAGGWAGSLTETATLRPLVDLSDLPDARFGYAVAVSDASVVVGAPNQTVGRGRR